MIARLLDCKLERPHTANELGRKPSAKVLAISRPESAAKGHYVQIYKNFINTQNGGAGISWACTASVTMMHSFQRHLITCRHVRGIIWFPLNLAMLTCLTHHCMWEGLDNELNQISTPHSTLKMAAEQPHWQTTFSCKDSIQSKAIFCVRPSCERAPVQSKHIPFAAQEPSLCHYWNTRPEHIWYESVTAQMLGCKFSCSILRLKACVVLSRLCKLSDLIWL